MDLQILLISILVGIALAFLTVSVMKSQMKTVRRQSGAGSYLCPGSLQLRVSEDVFLYQNTIKHPKPKQNK